MREAQSRQREPLWDVKRAAEYLGVSKSWLYHQTAAGSVPCRKVGQRLRFVPSELEAWVSRQPGTAGHA